MRIRSGTRARFTLADGSTFEGTVQRRWPFGAWRLTKVQAVTGSGNVNAAGRFVIPPRSVLYVQALHVELDSDDDSGEA